MLVLRPYYPTISRYTRDPSKCIVLSDSIFLSGVSEKMNHSQAYGESFQKRWAKKAKIVLCPYLGYDERIAQVVKDRLRG